MNMDSREIAQKVLHWYAEMGVDEALGTEPTDWFELSHKQAEARKASAPGPAAASVPGRVPVARQDAPPMGMAAVAPDDAALAAKDLAASAQDLTALEAVVRGFEGCALKKTAKHTCFKRGSDEARVMFIGEGPGRDEDLQGRPFVGRAGQLLDKMLHAAGFEESDVYITNIVYWRPPGNRTPTPQEVQMCAPFLERQIELLDPAFIVLIGAPSSHHVLDVSEGITRLRGKWKTAEIGGKPRSCLPILHPAYLLRTPAAKRLAWQDMLAIKEKFIGLEET